MSEQEVRYEPQMRTGPTEPKTLDEKLLRDPWTFVGDDTLSCPVCGAMVHLRDVQTHSAWHLR